MTLATPPPTSFPPAARAETPMAFVNAIVSAFEQRGLDPTPVLAEAQIAPNLLRQPQARGHTTVKIRPRGEVRGSPDRRKVQIDYRVVLGGEAAGEEHLRHA